MSYFVSAFLQEAVTANVDVHTSSSPGDPWENFNRSVRALGQHGRIEEVRQAGNWYERFDIVRGTISGMVIVIYGPRWRDEPPKEPVHHDPIELLDPKRDLVRQLADELEAQRAN